MLKFQTLVMLMATDLRDRTSVLVRRGRENGAHTVEYVVIAAVVFAAAIGLAAIINSAITSRQDDIYDGMPLLP